MVYVLDQYSKHRDCSRQPDSAVDDLKLKNVLVKTIELQCKK